MIMEQDKPIWLKWLDTGLNRQSSFSNELREFCPGSYYTVYINVSEREECLTKNILLGYIYCELCRIEISSKEQL